MTAIRSFSSTSKLLLLVTLISFPLIFLVGCSDDDTITAPGVTVDPWAISLVRSDWFWASAPLLGEGYLSQVQDQRTFDPADRVETVRWYLPRDRVLRRYLDPDLVNQERDETQPVMEAYLRADDGTWDPEDWGGIMRSISRTGLDLTQAQYVDIWLNDGVPDINQRGGKVHLDFGYISEDGFWPVDGDGRLVVGEWEREDGILPGDWPDGFWISDEDIGLDGNEFGPQRFDAAFAIDGDSPYPRINGTARNNREDDEDLNGNGRLDYDDGYFTTTIDLKESPAVVDVVDDYDDVQDLVDANIAWRKYRLAFAGLDSVNVGATPNLQRVTHVRIWYEHADLPAAVTRLQFSDLKFVATTAP